MTPNATDNPPLFKREEFPLAEFHRIEISVPVPKGSIVEQAKIMTSYQDQLTALYAALPAESEKRDYVSRERVEVTKRKTIAERVNDEIAKRGLVAPAEDGTYDARPGRRAHAAAAQ